MISPQAARAVEDWLAQGRARKGYSPATLAAYGADARRFLLFLAGHEGGASGEPAPIATTERWRRPRLRSQGT